MTTAIEIDHNHRMLCERALLAIEGGKLKWRHHGIGVLQAYLSEGGPVEHRLHIWAKELVKDGIAESGDVHDHRFDMVSHVLFGVICHEEITFRPIPGDALQAWVIRPVVHARKAGEEAYFDAPLLAPGPERYAGSKATYLIPAGSLYRFGRGAFHRSPVLSFAITWVEKYNQSDEPARIAHPAHSPPVHAFGHEPDAELIAFLVKRAHAALRAVVPPGTSFEEMLAVAGAARRRQREEFQKKWGSFYRCTACGHRVHQWEDLPKETRDYIHDNGMGDIRIGVPDEEGAVKSSCCQAELRHHQYTPPPER